MGALGAHEGHQHPSEGAQARPFLASLRVKFGETRFRLGPAGRDSLNTLTIAGGEWVSIPARLRGMRRLDILHTGLDVPETVEGRIEIKYAGDEEPVVRQWKIHDWQAHSVEKPQKEVVSGLWWYRGDKGLVTDDANAKVYVEHVELDPARIVESVTLVTPKLPKAEVRIYAVSALGAKTEAWTAVDISKQFNGDTIHSEATRTPVNARMYFATEMTEMLATKKPLK
jgi:hypothetical protein